MTSIIKQHLLNTLEKGFRLDGRKTDEYRTVTVEYGISSKSAEGSAKATIGNTQVIAGVKMDVGTPYPDTLDQGNLITNSELLPLSSPLFLPGPPDPQSVELARIVDRGIRESGMIDLKKLCIREGELVWNILLDIYTINDDGNLIDAAALAAIAALRVAVLPKLEKDKVQFGEFTKTKVPIKSTPITCTIFKIGQSLIVDANRQEEESVDARLSVAISEDGQIHAMQKGGSIGFSLEEVDSAIGLAKKASEQLRKELTK